MSPRPKRAAQLCKADLLTEVVGEFPELQGLMGKYYAQAQGEDAGVAPPCEDHYKPVGPKDGARRDPVSVAVALADKIDTLVGFWAIDEKPTGSKRPLCTAPRAALGLIRIVIDNQLRLPLRRQLWRHFGSVERDEALAAAFTVLHPIHDQIVNISAADIELAMKLDVLVDARTRAATNPKLVRAHSYLTQTDDLLSFFADRLKDAVARAGRASRPCRCRCSRSKARTIC